MAFGIDLLLSTISNATFGVSSYDNPFLVTGNSEDSRYNNELNGIHLKIATYNNKPLSWIETTENGTQIGQGVAFLILEILQKKFNFTYELVVPEKNFEMGGSKPQESLVGLVNSSLVDMAAAFLPKQTSYREMVEFSHDLDDGVWKMLLKRPKDSAAGSGLLAPFNRVVWYITLMALLLYGPCITLFTYLRCKLVPDSKEFMPVYPCFWFVYGALLKQGTNLAPTTNTTRVLFTTWWIFIILLSAFYTANLTAFLTLSKFTLVIEAPKDLYKKNYRWVTREGAAVQYDVTNPNGDLYYLNKMIISGRGSFRTQKSSYDFLNLVDGGAVLIKEQIGIEFLMFGDYQRKAKLGIPEAERCTYVIAPKKFMTKLRGFAYPTGSKLRPIFDRAITYILQAGLIEFHKRQNLPRNRFCPLDLKSTDRQLRNSDLTMTYVVMGFGLSCSILIFGGELLIKHYTQTKIIDKKPKRKKTRFKNRPRIHNYYDSGPPSYDSIFGQSPKGKHFKRRIINGREYLMVNVPNGDIRLIPVRTPSAFLYELDYKRLAHQNK